MKTSDSITFPTHERPSRRWPRRLGGVLLGTLGALVLAEVLATCAMGGAYPFLNVYEADATLGVRLEPGSSTRVRSARGEVTEVVVNTQGFRGPAFRESEGAGRAGGVVAGRVLVVGDSQVLAYGVPEEAGFVARLAASGVDVMGAGVPTWGPAEYALVARELVPRHRPEVLVVVVNVINDWSEADFPNARRTTARDGWAVAVVDGDVEAARSVSEFPLRRFVLGRSHLVLVLRLLLHGLPVASMPPAVRLASEAHLLAQTPPPWRSKLGRHLAAAKRVCAEHGCRVLPVLLPADVQVDRREWAKYVPDIDAAPDARPSLALNRGFLIDAAALELPALDLLEGLSGASPGAFLVDDFHLSARGHEVVAAALLEALRPERTNVSRSPSK